MKIQDLFIKDIQRNINGVVKADQLDDSNVWQELDEFVVTREIDKHLDHFFSRYAEALAKREDPENADKVGVWVSGFFGSGKSHFIKILSYLLGNRSVRHNGDERTALDFFEEKIKDAQLLGNIRNSVKSDSDVILFNIDSKAAQGQGNRDTAILAVFLKVFNEMQGYCGDYPHIAHMERYLAKKGKLEAFEAAFKEQAGAEWRAERDAYQFMQEEITQALSEVLGQKPDLLGKWLDTADSQFALTVENFCNWVKEYLDDKGPEHRIIFLVDEIGQYIGDNTSMMLNLQTITEQLGTVCNGRAWIVVTSQEDIDAVVGAVKQSTKNDFSKIQGRFRTRLSLSSANVDEVIRKRLLDKTPEAAAALKPVYEQTADIIRNQLHFSDVGMTFKNFDGPDSFAASYPFAPYQFQLVQKIFDAIRSMGATGKHLAKGERSMLDAFQSAARAMADREIGALAPLYSFYPSIESFLDTAVKRTIDQSADNKGLGPFDVSLLRTLFLIRYVEEMTGSVDNLVTLFVDHIDADRLALRKQLQESLARLEKETLIGRNGDLYYFLTNEERDVSKEIENIQLDSGEELRHIKDTIYEELLNETRKHRYTETGSDFDLNRYCDNFPVGSVGENNLAVRIYTQYFDGAEVINPLLKSADEGGQVIVQLPQNEALPRELCLYLKTNKYLLKKDTALMGASSSRIISERRVENRERKERLVRMMEDLLLQADWHAAGQKLELKAGTPVHLLSEAMTYLVKNTFSKMGYLTRTVSDPFKEMQIILRSNDVAQQTLALQAEENNPKAVAELRQFVQLSSATDRQIVLNSVLERFGKRPYGWPEREVLLMLVRMCVAGEILFYHQSEPLQREKAYDTLSKPSLWKQVLVRMRKCVDTAQLQAARKLGNDLFAQTGPDNEEELFTFFKTQLTGWQHKLSLYEIQAKDGNPGQEEIHEARRALVPLLNEAGGYGFMVRALGLRGELLDVADTYHDISHFYDAQFDSWKKLKQALTRFNLNRNELEQDADARQALERMRTIAANKHPYGMIKEVSGLIATVEAVNARLLDDARADAQTALEGRIAAVRADLKQAELADKDFQERVLDELACMVQEIKSAQYLAQLQQLASRADIAAVRAAESIAAEQQRLIAAENSGGQVYTPKQTVKPITVVQPSLVLGGGNLETEEAVTEFITKLQAQLMKEIKAGKRIQIR
jgi:hypothetical protein